MRTLAAVWNRPARRDFASDVAWRDPKQLIGIEIEAEGALPGALLPSAAAVSPHWERGSDGSLRNGYEYRLFAPKAGNELSAAISQFFDGQVNVVKALTSGTHVHIDMMEETTSINSVQALVLLVYILEPAIFHIVDPGREWCGYTNGLETAPSVLLSSILKDGLDDDPSPLVNVAENGKQYKYYGLNIQPLARFGSVEFRYFPTASSSAELIDWIQMVQAFKIAANVSGGKSGVASILSNPRNYEQFITEQFSDWADRMLSIVPYDVAVKRHSQAWFTATGDRAAMSVFDPAVLTSKQFKKFSTKARKAGAAGARFMPRIVVQRGLAGDTYHTHRPAGGWTPGDIIVGRDQVRVIAYDAQPVLIRGSWYEEQGAATRALSTTPQWQELVRNCGAVITHMHEKGQEMYIEATARGSTQASQNGTSAVNVIGRFAALLQQEYAYLHIGGVDDAVPTQPTWTFRPVRSSH